MTEDMQYEWLSPEEAQQAYYKIKNNLHKLSREIDEVDNRSLGHSPYREVLQERHSALCKLMWELPSTVQGLVLLSMTERMDKNDILTKFLIQERKDHAAGIECTDIILGDKEITDELIRIIQKTNESTDRVLAEMANSFDERMSRRYR